MQTTFNFEKVYTLVELNEKAKQAIKKEFGEYIWVCGEIQDFRERQHINLNLVQKGKDSDDLIAQVKAVIFENIKQRIFSRLKEVDSSLELKKDIEVKLLCKVDLYVKTGQFSLTVFDIDPVYTLGKIAQNRIKIIEELKAKGLLEKNKVLKIPLVPLRIGLITSHDSAAYHDFINELQISGFGFKVVVFDSYMQGKATEGDVVAGINSFNKLSVDSLDVIVITRGGGSTADLSWFDNKNIAETIANCKFPVITALGHQINVTIADMVAHTSVKTPTKSAQVLTEAVVKFSEALKLLQENISKASLDFLDKRKTIIETAAIKIDSGLSRYFGDSKEELLEKRLNILNLAKQYLATRNVEIQGDFEQLQNSLSQLFQKSQDYLNHAQEKIKLLDPQAILKKGYSLTTKDGKVVKTLDEIKEKDIIKTLIYQGAITSQVVNKEEMEKN